MGKTSHCEALQRRGNLLVPGRLLRYARNDSFDTSLLRRTRNDGNRHRRKPGFTARQSGYLLLPVAVAIALIGVIAFLISSESAIEVDMTAGELNAARAEYVAQAGLQHALQHRAQQGCGPYSDLTNVAFGLDEYDTKLTHDLGSTTPYTIPVDQDAWIRNDQPSVNKGADQKLHTRFEGGNIEYPLLRYDLSSIPAKTAVLSATGWFYLTNVHPEGPVDLHPITADWAEADATWDSMNANIGASVIGSIPSQATAGTWVPVNLTSQVQAWVNGEVNHGIALGTTSEGSHGQYNSRESANAPYLEVTVGTPPTSPAKLKSTSKLDGGGAATVIRDDVYLRQSPPSHTQLVLSDGAGQDVMLDSFYSSRNYGNHEIEVETIGSDENSLIRFDRLAIPPGARINSARLELYHYLTENTQVNPAVEVYRVTRDWVEGTLDGTGTADGATWQTWDGSSSWTQNGGDHDVLPVASSDISPAINDWEGWEIGELVQGWVDGTYPNYGLLLKGTGSIEVRFASKEDADPALRPRLTISYSCTCIEVCVTPQGSGKIALIGDDATPDPDDQVKIAIIESWGYDVDYYEDLDADTINWSNYDLAYVSETIISSDFSGNPANIPIGVVNEEPKLYDEFLLASSESEHVGDSIDIVDNSHYITMVFPQGALPIYTAAMEILSANTPLAPDLQILGEFSGAASLTAIEKGAAANGGTATARRVTLPLGQHFAAGFDWSKLNSNGYLLVQRAIEWGMNKKGPAATVPGIWVSTLGDVTGSGAPGLDAWTDGEAISFEDPNLLLEPGPTNGTFVSQINIDDFAGDADIDAIHYVGSSITVGGGANTIDLQPGDLLLSTAANESLNSSNSLSVNDEDVFAFRPDTADDYSSGTFTFVLDGSQISGDPIVAISLVEKDTAVGDALVASGTFLFNTTNRRDVQTFVPTGVGSGTTSGTVGELVDGPDVNLGSEIRGLDLVEDEFPLGGHTIPRGVILMTLNNDGSNSGDNGVPTDSEDVFYLTMTQTGASSIGDATLLFDGSDVSLDTSNEHLQALTLRPPPGGFPVLPPQLLFIVTDPDSLTAYESAKKTLIESWGYTVNLIDDADSLTNFYNAFAANDVVYISGEASDTAIGSKLIKAPLGIVNEQIALHDELLLSTGAASYDFTNVLVINNTHYITEGINTGWHTIAGSDQPLNALTGTLAPGMTNLAEVWISGANYDFGLAVVDTDGQLNAGELAAGRRVQLPWGTASFDFSSLNANGQNLMQRAIEWAGGAEIDLGPIAHWKLDETTGPTAVDSEGGHDGTLSGGTWTSGLDNGALEFDGSDDYVDLTSDAELDDVFLNGATVMAWIYLEGWGEGAYGRVLDKSSETSGNRDGWMIGTDGGNESIAFAQGFTGTRGFWRPQNNAVNLNEWVHYAIAYDASSDTNDPTIYLNGVAQTSLVEITPSGTIRSDESINLRMGNHAQSTSRTLDGTLDDVRIYDRILGANEITDLYNASAPQTAGYVEANQTWSATDDGTWQTVDLSSFGVPPNAVVEVVVENTQTGGEREGGVRAVGSTVGRHYDLQEAEGGGVDTVTLHVQADASSQIQHYAENDSSIRFRMIGYWTAGSYSDRDVLFTAGANNSWRTRSLSAYGVAPGQIVEIIAQNNNGSNEYLAGVRASGSSNTQTFDLHEAQAGGRDFLSIFVEASGDASASIEVFAENDGEIEFKVVGVWDTPPGTYTEARAVLGNPTTDSSWQTVDLSGFGVPPNSVVQIVMANRFASARNRQGVRSVGSSMARYIDIHEAEDGGEDLTTIHVPVDGSSQIQWFHQDVSEAHNFYLVGWWVLSP